MKKVLFVLSIVTISFLSAKMIYDPVQDIVYSTNSKIDIKKYNILILDCLKIAKNMCGLYGYKEENYNEFINIYAKDVLQEIYVYLRKVGTPTAHQLIEDFQDNHVYSTDGVVLRKMFNA